MEKKTLGLVFGGRTPEHDVSLVSAKGIYPNLDRDRYDVVLIGVDRQGIPRVGGEELLDGGMDSGTGAPCRWPSAPHDRAMRHETTAEAVTPPLDVVFPIIHGPGGEDGTLQGVMELAGIACVGPGVLGSSLAMDKDRSRRMLELEGIPVIEDLVVHADEANDVETVLERLQSLEWYPDTLFVKPARAGSSVGITRVTEEDQLAEALRVAFEVDSKVVIERGIEEPREIEFAVLGLDELGVSLPGEIEPHGEFYDYKAKYDDPESKLLIPAPIDDELMQEMRTIAAQAFCALDLHGLARVDFLLSRTTGRFVLNEVNTLPGFTPISMYPQLWEATGLPYAQMLDQLVDIAFAALERSAIREMSQRD